MKGVMVLFPGIGYTCEKPLLYYAAKLAQESGMEVIRVAYGRFPQGAKGNAEKMHLSFLTALEQAEEVLKDTDWNAYDPIVFVGKSIGTVVSACYAKHHGLQVRHVLLTPVEETFAYTEGQAIAFHGTADPWVETELVRHRCEEQSIALYETEDANHSLETGHVGTDLATLRETLERIQSFLNLRQEQLQI